MNLYPSHAHSQHFQQCENGHDAAPLAPIRLELDKRACSQLAWRLRNSSESGITTRHTPVICSGKRVMACMRHASRGQPRLELGARRDKDSKQTRTSKRLADMGASSHAPIVLPGRACLTGSRNCGSAWHLSCYRFMKRVVGSLVTKKHAPERSNSGDGWLSPVPHLVVAFRVLSPFPVLAPLLTQVALCDVQHETHRTKHQEQ